MLNVETDSHPFDDLVSPATVERLILDADGELGQLELAAAEANASAERAEAQVAEAGADADSMTWMMVRLQQFIEQLRVEVERESVALLDVSRLQARRRIEAAREEARSLRTGQVEGIRPSPPAPTRTADTLPPASEAPTLHRGPDSFEEWRPTVTGDASPANGNGAHQKSEPDAAAQAQVAVDGKADAPVATASPIVASDNAPHSAAAPVASKTTADHTAPLTVALAPRPATKPTEQVADANKVIPAASTVVDPLAPEVDAAAVSSAFWDNPGAEKERGKASTKEKAKGKTKEPAKEEATQSKKRQRHVPLAAILQVGAVIVILVFILLRLR